MFQLRQIECVQHRGHRDHRGHEHLDTPCLVFQGSRVVQILYSLDRHNTHMIFRLSSSYYSYIHVMDFFQQRQVQLKIRLIQYLTSFQHRCQRQ
jgi:hypothetical protein